MTDELKPCHCGCGGKAMPYVSPITTRWLLQCESCKIETAFYDTEAEAIEAWNTAMGRKTGKWIEVDDDVVNGRCSVCGYESYLYENNIYGEHFCPNCGAEMKND